MRKKPLLISNFTNDLTTVKTKQKKQAQPNILDLQKLPKLKGC